ncbi:YcxB family protein [Cohnella rhizosphaerae]|uniref:YcxB family protein n=1 Tax=Cohnella rhizosphaerae TaxID=1457232 RepID=A0A9X4QV08_9BACL|nr:YcxB family protein [Cohnella rhizosphaerae]MDG0811933.1 YcxB family protein [Cohnella rhizosphaerae]
MEKIVRAAFDTTEKDLVALNTRHFYGSPGFVFFILVCGANFIYMALSVLKEGGGAADHFHFVQWLLLFFGLFIPASAYLRAVQAIKRRFAAEHREYEFDASGFRYRAPTAQGQVAWADVRRFAIDRRMIVLYVGQKGVSLIPARSLSGREDLAQLKNWIRQSVPSQIVRRAARNRALFYAGIAAAVIIAAALAFA